MFETEADAKKYAKDNNIKTGWFRNNKIVEQKDGTFAIENKKEHSSTSDLGGELGVVEGGMVAANDVMATKYEGGGFDIFTDLKHTQTLRDGSEKDVTPLTGVAPGSMTRVPGGKAFWDIVKGAVRKGGQWMRKDKKGYLELDPKKLTSPKTYTDKPKPFSPKVEPTAKSKWKHIMDMLGNFDDPRF